MILHKKSKPELIIFVSGPLGIRDGLSTEAIENNVLTANKYGARIFGAGHIAIIPHNYYYTYKHLAVPMSEPQWLNKCIDLLVLCDAMFMIPGWDNSYGATREREEAMLLQILIFQDIEKLEAWDGIDR